jgi:hypothetical protein
MFFSQINLECSQLLITPNGDRESDSYFFTLTSKVTIYIANINNGEEAITISVVY